MNIKKNDKVVVISGDEKGKSGIVIELDLKNERVRVQGISLQKKHYKAKNNNEKSDIRIKERFIHVSNVALDKNKVAA